MTRTAGLQRPGAVQRPGTTKTLSTGRYGGTVRRTVLPGGLRVITEALPAVRSAAFGIWVGIGSRDEVPSLAGSSHFLEHLLFKGTRRRTALEISSALEAVGGEMNAFTGKEFTCYYARVLDDDLPLAIDVVSDMVTSSVIATEEFEVERGVILEEISMHDDDPGDVVHDVFADAVFGDTPLGRPIVGSVPSIRGMRRDQVAGFYRRRYQPGQIVVSAAGNLEHTQVVRLVRKAFTEAGLVVDDGVPAAPRSAAPRSATRPPAGGPPGLRVVDRKTEQAHVVVGARGLDRFDDRRFALAVLNSAFGGGMSSRLFQEVREKRGLAYSIYSFDSEFADTGLLGIYAGCAPARVDEVLALLRDQVGEVAARGLADEEIRRGQGQLKGGMVLGLEDTCSRMTRIGKGELTYGEVLEIDELIARIDAVTAEDVRAVAAELFDQPMSLGVIGPFADHDFSATVSA